MKCKVINIILIFIGFYFMSSALFATDNTQFNSVPEFIDHLNQKATVEKQKNEANQRAFIAELNQINSTKATNNSEQTIAKFSQDTTVSSTKTVNCNDPNNPNNYPSNYFYDHQNRKIYQKQPFAKCLKSTSPKTQTIPSTTAPVVITPKKDVNETQWNINY